MIGAEPPLIVMLTLEGAYVTYYRIRGASHDFDDVFPTIDRAILNLPLRAICAASSTGVHHSTGRAQPLVELH